MTSELRPLLRLAGPVVLAEIGWMSMGLVDTLMVGRLGPAAIGATGMGSGVFTAIVIFGMGLMLGLDALVSRATGAGRPDESVRWLHQGVVLAFCAAPFVMLLTWAAYLSIDAWGLNPQIRVLVGPYLVVIALGALPLLLYAAFRRYLQGIHVVGPIMFALVSANIVNAAANAILIYGRFGIPALGVTGSAWATCLARVYMAAFLFFAIRREHRRRGAAHPSVPFVFDAARMRTLIALGAPAASQIPRWPGGSTPCRRRRTRSRSTSRAWCSWCRSDWRRPARCAWDMRSGRATSIARGRPAGPRWRSAAW
jgi:MATE family multidrug resistance protein